MYVCWYHRRKFKIGLWSDLVPDAVSHLKNQCYLQRHMMIVSHNTLTTWGSHEGKYKCYSLVDVALWPRNRINIKMPSKYSHYKNKAVSWPSYLYKRKLFTRKRILILIQGREGLGEANVIANLANTAFTLQLSHYTDVTMGAITSQITSPTIVYSTVYSDADQRKHKSSASLAFVRRIHRGPVNYPHKWPVTRKMFPFDDVIMIWTHYYRWF